MTNFNIKTTNIEMTDAISSYLDKRLSKLDKFMKKDEPAVGQVEIGTITRGQNSGDIFRAEINLSLGGHSFRAESEKDDLYKAIDDAQDEMIRQLKSFKNKQRSMERKGGYQLKKLLKFRGRKLR